MTANETKKTTKAPAKAKKHATLVEALAAFQADLPDVTLDGVNPHFKSKYATLAGITKKVLPVLTEHGFAFSVGSFVDNGTLVLDAHLIHETGESRSAQFPITETNPQKVGSAVSYYRRYALSALTGIVADEDDDGNTASVPTPVPPAIQKAKEQAAKAPAAKAKVTGSRADIKTEFLDTGLKTTDEINKAITEVQDVLKVDNRDEKVYAEVLKRLRAEK